MLAVLGCGESDPLVLRPGDVLIPVVTTTPEWPATSGGMIAFGLRAEGGDRATATTIPAEKFPAGTLVTAEVRFAGPDGEPVGPIVQPEFAPDC